MPSVIGVIGQRQGIPPPRRANRIQRKSGKVNRATHTHASHLVANRRPAHAGGIYGHGQSDPETTAYGQVPSLPSSPSRDTLLRAVPDAACYVHTRRGAGLPLPESACEDGGCLAKGAKETKERAGVAVFTCAGPDLDRGLPSIHAPHSALQHSAFSFQRSAFSAQLSALSFQRSAFSAQHSALSVQRSAFSTQRSAFGFLHSAFSIQHSALSVPAFGIRHSAFSLWHSAFSTQRSAFQHSALSAQLSALDLRAATRVLKASHRPRFPFPKFSLPNFPGTRHASAEQGDW